MYVIFLSHMLDRILNQVLEKKIVDAPKTHLEPNMYCEWNHDCDQHRMYEMIFVLIIMCVHSNLPFHSNNRIYALLFSNSKNWSN